MSEFSITQIREFVGKGYRSIAARMCRDMLKEYDKLYHYHNRLTRKYTTVDLVRFGKIARENPELKPLELLAKYNKEHPEIILTASEQLRNLAEVTGITNLVKAIDNIQNKEGGQDE